MAILNINADQFVPVSAAPAGAPTVSTSGVYVTFSANTEVKKGDYICDATQKESRMVTYVSRSNPLHATIETPFSSDLAADAVQYIGRSDLKITSMGIAADQGSDTEVDGVTITDGTSVNFATTNSKADRGLGYVKPVYIEGSTTGACTVTVQNFRN